MTKKNKKILIVEDDQFTLKLYAHLLEEEGFAVIKTPTSKEVMRLALSDKPDLFIIDLMLVEGDGFKVIKELRKTNQFKKTPIIVLSNLGQETDINEAVANGANKYFVKSNTRFQEVVETVKKLIK